MYYGFKKVFGDHMKNNQQLVNNGLLIGIFILFFISNYNDTNHHNFQFDRFRSCYPSSDLIGHGDKTIATNLYVSTHAHRCDISLAKSGYIYLIF